MTVIIGITDGRTIWMGADSFVGNSNYALQMKQSKIIRRQLPNGSDILFGCSGEMRVMLLLGAMELPDHKPGMDALYYVGIDLVNTMRSVFGDAGYATAQDGREGAGDACVLVGYDGRLFALWSDYTHAEPATDYMVMGSGMEVALGALAVTDGIPPRRRLEMVLEAVAQHSPYVRAPFTFEEIRLSGSAKEYEQ